MNGVDPKSVEAILRPLAVDPSVKHAAWDGFFSAQSPVEFRQHFDSLGIPRQAKSQLWRLKFSAPVAPAPAPAPAPTTGPAEPAGQPEAVSRFLPFGAAPPPTSLPPLPDIRQPMADLTPFTREPTEAATGYGKFALGLERGVARGVSGLTSPENVGLIGAMKLAPRVLGQAGRFVAGGAGLFFTFEMAKALVESVPEAHKAWKAGDWAQLGEVVGEDVVTALLLGAGGKHVRGQAAVEPGRAPGKPIYPVPESKAGRARLRAEAPPGPPGAVMSREQRRALSEIPQTGEPAAPGPSVEPMETANRRRIAERLGMDFDRMPPEQQARLDEIQHQMNLGALQNMAQPPPAWWPPPPPSRTALAAGEPPSWWPTTATPKGRPELPPLPEVPPPAVARAAEPEPVRAPAAPAPAAPPAEAPGRPPEPAPREPIVPAEAGRVAYMPTSEINADPTRFQFKIRGIGAKGVSEELRQVTVWNPDLAGVLAVWRDPANGKVYVVNGHHRLELAQRLKVGEVPVRFVEAENATVARGKGALINIAEGRGTAVDAAKVFRDLSIGPDQLQKAGVSLRGPVSRDALALSGLPADIFEKVWREQITPQRGVILGEMLEGRAQDQRAVLEIVERAENRGKRPTDEQIREMIRLQLGSGETRTEVQQTLFGAEEVQRAALLERAQISEYIRKELLQDKRLFLTVAQEKGAQKLGEAGNVIRAEQNARVATQTAQAIELYDKLSTKAGPVNEVLTKAANELAEGGEPGATKRRAYQEIRRVIADLIPGANQPRGGPERSAGTAPTGAGRGGETVPELPVSVPRPAEGRTLERIERVEGPPYDVRSKVHDLSVEAEVKAGDIEGFPVIFANSQAMALFSWGGYSAHNPATDGRCMPHSAALEIIGNLQGLAESYPFLSERCMRMGSMLRALRQNREAADGRPLVMLDTSPHKTEQRIREAVVEELDHAAQLTATGVKLKEHVGPRFFENPLAQQAARQLRERGYSDVDDGIMSLEIGVRLMEPGKYKELGLTPQEALQLAEYYCDTLEGRHSSGTVAKIVGKVYDAFKELSHEARQTSHPGRRRGREAESAEAAAHQAGAGIGGLSGSLAEAERHRSLERAGPEAAETPLFGSDVRQQVEADKAAYERKLEADRLSAQFRAPLTREEQLRKLKRARAAPQQELFGGPVPPEPQGSLFRLPPIPGLSPTSNRRMYP